MNLKQFFLPILKPYKWWFLLIFQAGFFGSFYSFMWYYAIKILIEKTSLIANNQQIAWQEFIFPVAIFIGAEIFVNTVWRFSNYGTVVVKQIADLTSAFSIIQIKQQVLDKPLSQELNI